jgi:hypothetical protein
LAEIEVLYPAPKSDNPWLQIAGIYRDDPHFEEWQAEIEADRRNRDLKDQVQGILPGTY